jgi:hypothetical protein
LILKSSLRGRLKSRVYRGIRKGRLQPSLLTLRRRCPVCSNDSSVSTLQRRNGAAPRSVRSICAGINSWRCSGEGRLVWFVRRLRYRWRRQGNHFILSLRAAFTLQPRPKGIPTLCTNNVFRAINFMLSTIPNFITQIASVSDHWTTPLCDGTAHISAGQGAGAGRPKEISGSHEPGDLGYDLIRETSLPEAAGQIPRAP